MGILTTIGTALASPAAATLGGVASGVINAVQNRSNIDRQNKANMELSRYQYSKDLEMWNRGNEYNAPQAQMERLKAAKLNPNLVYGSGAVAGQSAQQLPKYNAPQLDYNYQPPVDIPKTLGATQDFRIQQAQIDNLKAQKKQTDVDTLLKTVEYTAQTMPTYAEGETSQMNFKERFNLEKFQKLLQDNERQRKMFPGQLDALAIKNRVGEGQLNVQIAQIAKMQAETVLKDLERDMFMPAFWAKTLTGGLNTIKGIAALKTKTVPPALNKKTFRGSPSWRQPGVGKRIRYVKP
ncbi:MAG: DNA pilot protein [Microvirus sp.]|nr:MAG: DNA pilot protein [Microvirus sp.]